MRWSLTLYGGENHGATVTFEADTADEARRIARMELQRREARIYELEKID